MKNSCPANGHHRSYPHLYVAVFFILCFSSCAEHEMVSHNSDDIKNHILAYSPELFDEKIVIPFEVDESHIEKAIIATSGWVNQLDRANRLMHSLFDPDQFGIEYAPIVTATAKETLKTGKGNCLSIASVFIGLARGIGLIANYLDASAQVNEMFKYDEFIINSGHITAVVQTNEGKLGLDFGNLISGFGLLRRMSDIEAIAHFYNNRGYELLAMAREDNSPVDWKNVTKNFVIATKAMPEFAQGWNNLGIVQSRQGHYQYAKAAYLRAIRIDPDFATSYYNLGILYATQNKHKEALDAFKKAIELDDSRAHFHYRQGISLYKTKQFALCAKALKRSIELNEGNTNARLLLKNVYNRLGWKDTSKQAVSIQPDP